MNWKDLSIATGSTHHEFQGMPAYPEHYDEVLKFHPPGLAPVRRAGQAWHIHPDGRAAYSIRFERTFGFYEGLAAVIDEDGWHHIDVAGLETYSDRYDWCGNFQSGRCAVRIRDGRYCHLMQDGTRLYKNIWRYAGDYKDGFCVVQDDQGQSTHLDMSGKPLHGKWFQDLDVFHKGFARARDEGGWMHVSLDGLPIYIRRFAAVEPFYNGQARVERSDGGMEVINELGETLIELRPAMESEFSKLSADMVGFWRTQTIAAAVETGVVDALPGRSNDIAQRLKLNEDRCQRLILALGELGLVTRKDQTWDISPRGQYLRSKHPQTLADAALEYGSEFTEAWQQLPFALQAKSNWRAPQVFTNVAKDNARRTSHHRMLASYAMHDYATIPVSMELTGTEHIIDVGGGTGSLSSFLLETYPELQVTLLDLPPVVAEASKSVKGADGRLRFHGCDLFSPWDMKADVLVLARVLHDWDDENALKILSRAREALPTGGKLFIIEMLLSETSFAGRLCDLHLLMATGGRERTRNEFLNLMAQTGFTFKEECRLNALPSILIGVAK